MPAHISPTRRPGPGIRPSGHRAVLGSYVAPASITRLGDDELLLLLLVSTWELATARPAPAMTPTEMTEDELIEYWSDPADDPCPPGCPAPHPALQPGAAAGVPAEAAE